MGDLEHQYYLSVLGQDGTLDDLRRGYFAGLINGDIVLGGGGGNFQYPQKTGATRWNLPTQPGGTITPTAGTIYFIPFPVGHVCSITGVMFEVVTPQVGALVSLALYSDGASDLFSGAAKVADLVVGASAAAAGKVSIEGLSVALTPGRYWVAVLIDTAAVTFKWVGQQLYPQNPQSAAASVGRTGWYVADTGQSALPAVAPAAPSSVETQQLWLGWRIE